MGTPAQAMSPLGADRFYRCASSNPAHDRQCQRRRFHGHGLCGGGWVSPARPPSITCASNPRFAQGIWQFQHFDRPRPMRQAANEPTLFQGGDKTVNSRFGSQIKARPSSRQKRAQRPLSPIPRVDQLEQFDLLACQHCAAFRLGPPVLCSNSVSLTGQAAIYRICSPALRGPIMGRAHQQRVGQAPEVTTTRCLGC